MSHCKSNKEAVTNRSHSKKPEKRKGHRTREHRKERSSSSPCLLKTLMGEVRQPLVGVRFVMEIYRQGGPTFTCVLCRVRDLAVTEIMPHLISSSHRLEFLRWFSWSEYSRLLSFSDKDQPEEQDSELLEWTRKIETHLGRGRPVLVPRDLVPDDQADPPHLLSESVMAALDIALSDPSLEFKNPSLEGQVSQSSNLDAKDAAVTPADFNVIANEGDVGLALQVMEMLADAIMDFKLSDMSAPYKRAIKKMVMSHRSSRFLREIVEVVDCYNKLNSHGKNNDSASSPSSRIQKDGIRNSNKTPFTLRLSKAEAESSIDDKLTSVPLSTRAQNSFNTTKALLKRKSDITQALDYLEDLAFGIKKKTSLKEDLNECLQKGEGESLFSPRKAISDGKFASSCICDDGIVWEIPKRPSSKDSLEGSEGSLSDKKYGCMEIQPFTPPANSLFPGDMSLVPSSYSLPPSPSNLGYFGVGREFFNQSRLFESTNSIFFNRSNEGMFGNMFPNMRAPFSNEATFSPFQGPMFPGSDASNSPPPWANDGRLSTESPFSLCPNAFNTCSPFITQFPFNVPPQPFIYNPYPAFNTFGFSQPSPPCPPPDPVGFRPRPPFFRRRNKKRKRNNTKKLSNGVSQSTPKEGSPEQKVVEEPP